MHPRLREAVEPLIEEDEDIDRIIGIAERHDSTLRKNNSYGKANTSRSEQRPKQAKQGKRFTPAKGKERSAQQDSPKRDKESRVCYECGKPSHLAKDCFSKKKGKGKQTPKKAAVNIAECDSSESETTEVWINSTNVPTNVTEPISSYKTQSLGIKPSTAL